MIERSEETVARGSVLTPDGCSLSYELAGSGPPAVLIHGLGGNMSIWSRLRDRLAEQNTVLTYDLRGSGASREADRRELTLTVWSDDLHGLLDALAIERPVLVGHSLGASIALKLALRWPDRAAGLVLMGADPDLSRLGPRFQKVVGLIREVGMQEWVDSYWSTNTPFSAASLERTPGILDEYRAMVLANDPEDYIRTCLAISGSESLAGELGRIALPALVISGGDDDRTLPEAGRELAGKLGNASFIEIPAVGHSIPLEAPGAVGDAIDAFLASIDSDR